jgi:hypothetical protein
MSHPQEHDDDRGLLASENCILQPNFGENPFYEVR